MARRAPHPGLAHVDGYCGYVERSAIPVRRREVANGRIALIISFGEPIEVTTTSGRGTRTSFVAGLYDGFVITEYSGLQHGIQVDLTPLGAYRLLGMPMREIANQAVELDALHLRGFDGLVERLAATPGWGARFELLDRVLLSRMDAGPDVNPAVAWAWRQLERSHGGVAVGWLAEEIGWSRRHFVARFREQVGLAPKPTGRVLRFCRAIELLNGSGTRSISEVAAASGYADHSHLIREFRRLAGCTPSAFVVAQQADLNGVAVDA